MNGGQAMFRLRAFVGVLCGILFAGSLFPSIAGAQTESGPANGASDQPSVSSDGRYSAFRSMATNLVPGDNNGFSDVFVRDRTNAVTIRASVDTNGGPGNGASEDPAMSSNGRYVVFASDAEDLIGTDNNTDRDIFVRDLQTGTTERVSVSSQELEANGNSNEPAISADGRYVVFSSRATNLIGSADTNGDDDIFLRDRTLGTTERVSLTHNDVQADDNSVLPAVSSDGRWIGFRTQAALVTSDTNGMSDVYVRDRSGGNTYLISSSASGQPGEDATENNNWISDNGTHVVFPSDSSNILPPDSDGNYDVYRRSLPAGTPSRSSVNRDGGQGNGSSLWASVSANGNKVAYYSYATNLDKDTTDSNAVQDVFVRDHSANTTKRVSVSSEGDQANGVSDFAQIAAGGNYVVFQSDATNLVADDTNGVKDIFLRDVAGQTTSRVSVTTGSQAPVVQLNVEPEEGDTTTTFDATISATDPDGQALTYKIDWGDGEVTNASSGTHQYDTAGEYTVTGTATDSQGVAGGDQVIVRVCEVYQNGECVSADSTIDDASETAEETASPVTDPVDSGPPGVEGTPLCQGDPYDPVEGDCIRVGSVPRSFSDSTEAFTTDFDAKAPCGEPTNGDRYRVVYVHTDAENRYGTLKESLRKAALRADYNLYKSARQNGASRHFRFSCNEDDEIRVDSMKLADNAKKSYRALMRLMRDKSKQTGPNRYDATKRYLVFADWEFPDVDKPAASDPDLVYCGIARTREDDQPGRANFNNRPDRIHVVYLRPLLDCQDSKAWLAFHELGHGLGAFPTQDTPDWAPGGHAADTFDALNPAAPGPDDEGDECPNRADANRYDCGDNSYFNADPTLSADHWLADKAEFESGQCEGGPTNCHWNTAWSGWLIGGGSRFPPVCAGLSCSESPNSNLMWFTVDIKSADRRGSRDVG